MDYIIKLIKNNHDLTPEIQEKLIELSSLPSINNFSIHNNDILD